jgi:transposase-like protein
MALSKIYTDETAARKHLETLLWPDGPVCPHCGSIDGATLLQGKSTRPGVYKCRACEKPFSVTVGTVMERSKIPLHQWVYATHLMTASKKGISAHQISRMLGVTYKTAWFLAHRIREAMTDTSSGSIGGEGKFIEADETHIGGKAKNRAYVKRPPKKHAVMSLVERGGAARSFHIANVTAKSLRPLIVKAASRKSHLRTDEGKWYQRVGEEFASHSAVNHAQDEYVRGDASTNAAENYFSILKRGIYGTYQHVSEAHLQRYLAEFDFRYSHRSGFGVSDAERADRALAGTAGKRLTYRRPREGHQEEIEIPF